MTHLKPDKGHRNEPAKRVPAEHLASNSRGGTHWGALKLFKYSKGKEVAMEGGVSRFTVRRDLGTLDK